MIKLFQLISGIRAEEFLKACGEPGIVLIEGVQKSDISNFEYGDCRYPDKNIVSLSCDIMDYNFWHYHRICSKYGRFCFSVDSDLCDKQVYLSTIAYLKQSGSFQEYWGMIE